MCRRLPRTRRSWAFEVDLYSSTRLASCTAKRFQNGASHARMDPRSEASLSVWAYEEPIHLQVRCQARGGKLYYKIDVLATFGHRRSDGTYSGEEVVLVSLETLF